MRRFDADRNWPKGKAKEKEEAIETQNTNGNNNIWRGNTATTERRDKFNKLSIPIIRLPNPTLKQKIAVVLQPNASFQERIESIALPVQAVNNVGTRLDERSLQHIRQE
jgi:hypothetical protein